MKKRLISICFILIFTACTPSNNMSSIHQINYESSISYVFDPQLEKEAAASANSSLVSWDQLSSQDPALQELQEKHSVQVLNFSYQWAEKNAGEQSDNEQLEVFTFATLQSVDEVLDIQSDDSKIKVVVKNQQDPNLIAQFRGKKLSWDEFLASHTAHYQTYDALFGQRMQRLNGIVVRRFLLDWSKKENLSMEEYIKKHILKNPVRSTKEDALSFASQQGISKTDINEEMIEKLIEIVSQNKRQKTIEKFVAGKIKTNPIRVAFRDRSHKVILPQLAESELTWGDDAKESITYVGDWSCGNCQDAIRTFLEAKDKWGENLGGSLVFSFSDSDRHAYMAAEAVFCAQSQGNEVVWTFINAAIRDSDLDLEQKINQAAQDSQLDYAQFRDCFLKRKYKDKVTEHLKYAKGAGLFRTPLMIVGGELVAAPQDIQQLKETLVTRGISISPSIFTKILDWFGLN